MANTVPMVKRSVSYSVVIPVYNSSRSLWELAERIDRTFREKIGTAHETVFVDDASTDADTWPTLERITRRYPGTAAIRLAENHGQQTATLVGLAETGGDRVIAMDDDLQHRPEDIPRLIPHGAHDLVVAYFKEKKHAFLVQCTSLLKDQFSRIWFGHSRPVRFSSFWMADGRLARRLAAGFSPQPLLAPLFFTATRDAVNVVLEHGVRREGRSGYSLWKRGKTFTSWILSRNPFFGLTHLAFGLTLAAASLTLSVLLGFGHAVRFTGHPYGAGEILGLMAGGLGLAVFGWWCRTGFRSSRIIRSRRHVWIDKRISHEDTL